MRTDPTKMSLEDVNFNAALLGPDNRSERTPSSPLTTSFVSGTDRWDRPKRIAICTAASVLALFVGLQFGALAIEDATDWTSYLYRFVPSMLVNFMGSLLAIQDLFPALGKLKKDSDTKKRDAAVVGPFAISFILTVFAVVSTFPLAKDSTSGLLKPTGWFSEKVGLTDQSREALQWIGMIMWGIGYTATTRIDTGYAIVRELYENTLMRFLQKDRYALIMLSRDLKQFSEQAKTVFNSSSDKLISAEQVKQFYSLVDEKRASEGRCAYSPKEAITMALRYSLMLGCLPLIPLLQDESERGWSELGVKQSVPDVILGAFATTAALIFFIRSSQLFLERLQLAFQNVAGRLEKVTVCSHPVHPLIAKGLSAAYLSVLAAVGVGSSFGWYFEAQEFASGTNPLRKATFEGYPIYFAVYAFIANFGFELNFTNRCINTANKHHVSVLKAAAHLLSGLFALQDHRVDSEKTAEKRQQALLEGKKADGLNPLSLLSLRQRKAPVPDETTSFVAGSGCAVTIN